MISMSTRIRQARIHSSYSQAGLATLVGVRRSAVAQWENPHGTSPSTDHLSQIAMHTKVRFEWLATGRGKSKVDDFEEVAAVMEDFAHSYSESRMLEAMRRLSPPKQQMACEIVELLAKQPLKDPASKNASPSRRIEI